MGDNGEEGQATIDCSLGTLSLKVQGDDEEWVAETFEEMWDRRLDEAEGMAVAVRDGSRGCL